MTSWILQQLAASSVSTRHRPAQRSMRCGRATHGTVARGSAGNFQVCADRRIWIKERVDDVRSNIATLFLIERLLVGPSKKIIALEKANNIEW
jgi:hypothetical protein